MRAGASVEISPARSVIIEARPHRLVMLDDPVVAGEKRFERTRDLRALIVVDACQHPHEFHQNDAIDETRRLGRAAGLDEALSPRRLRRIVGDDQTNENIRIESDHRFLPLPARR